LFICKARSEGNASEEDELSDIADTIFPDLTVSFTVEKNKTWLSDVQEWHLRKRCQNYNEECLYHDLYVLSRYLYLWIMEYKFD
jgi:hypothetical protein